MRERERESEYLSVPVDAPCLFYKEAAETQKTITPYVLDIYGYTPALTPPLTTSSEFG